GDARAVSRKRTELRRFGHTEPLGSSQIFKNQAGMVTPEADKSPVTPGRHKATRSTFLSRASRSNEWRPTGQRPQVLEDLL
ncbi:MAG: hypothetical protein JW755_11400, partial [Candidatus Aminicenantes bacterium]|nr:hypothetical protein [Candidatus Aminicenantes bacterium]